jgi:tol-pal system protein YbgF
MKNLHISCSLIFLSVLTLNTAVAAPPKQDPNALYNAELEARISKLERVMGGSVLVDMQLRMEQLQTEVQQLRGELEQLSHEISEIKNHQRDLYQDIDRRLLALERGGVSSNTNGGETSQDNDALPSEAEQADYQKGINLLQEFAYGQAAEAFADYLEKYPQGRYAPIARYWLADSYYSDRKYEQAISQYQTLLKDYPQSSKAAQAWLKIGYSQAELKQWQAARESMQTVVEKFPNTTEASLAERYLIRLKQQGN